MTARSRPRNRRAQLADAAAALFGKRGYHSVGVGDIAAAAGITASALYRHFQNKQDVLGHVLLTGVDELAERVHDAVSGLADDPQSRLAPLLLAAAEVSIERRELTALWRWQGRHLREADQKELRGRAATLLSAWLTGLRRLRPELSSGQAHLLCFAALSVFGSVGDHRATPRSGFAPLLARLGEAVVRADLPTPAPRADGWRTRVAPAPSRREELLTAATRLFRERGFHAVSMDDIGAAGGIAGPSVYRHFAGKSDLLLAASRRMADRLTLGLEDSLATATDPADALRRLARSYVDTVLRSDDLIAVYTTELANLPERDGRELRAMQRGYVAEWVRLLREVAPGLDEPTARVAVHAALTIVNDIPRTQRFTTRPGLADELSTLAATVLRAAVEDR
ncbi:Transcriptional regulator, TetR family [Actinokineospora spheciospongiae]|uniref:Transcriptional regulator, TetR family n=1 Tax=Actinokineospora spheciospongiae TaxID=909613 RepID=W7IWW2_9PSEU|nr:TetR/AcrR family transcriptional regulator [Actinokineospora spheciospongiae]EWC60946.1 Transcriptional regulator, TetR family [Actinokineospora spheciospongiae]PWW62333.1 TetR family transcriptional regulator [Actinokineospora spheciospongiae]